MFFTTLYFIVCYGIVLCFIFGVLVSLGLCNVQPVTRKIALWLCLLVLPAPFVPYLKVAMQTSIYKEQMLSEVRTALKSMGEESDNILTFRVLRLNQSHANIYIVQPCGPPKDKLRSATTFHFKRTAGGWKFEEYDSPWSECGSAEGNTFPPYLDAREF